MECVVQDGMDGEGDLEEEAYLTKNITTFFLFWIIHHLSTAILSKILYSFIDLVEFIFPNRLGINPGVFHENNFTRRRLMQVNWTFAISNRIVQICWE